MSVYIRVLKRKSIVSGHWKLSVLEKFLGVRIIDSSQGDVRLPWQKKFRRVESQRFFVMHAGSEKPLARIYRLPDHWVGRIQALDVFLIFFR